MFVFEVKTSPPQEFKVNLDEGTFEGYAAAYGNIDDGGDRLHYGSGADIAKANPTLPIFYQHGWQQNEFPLGKSLYYEEREPGLWQKGKIFETSDGRDALVGMREGVIGQMSIGWNCKEKKMTQEGGRTVREVLKYDLFEYSLCANGFAMNPQALITAVKTGHIPFIPAHSVEAEAAEEEEAKIDLGDDHIEEKDYRALRTFVENADPIGLLLDEATYLHTLAEDLKAEGREDEVRQALKELETAALLLKGICAVNDIEVPDQSDLVALIRQTTANIHEASRTLSS